MDATHRYITHSESGAIRRRHIEATLRSVSRIVSAVYVTPSGKHSQPHFNTWIEKDEIVGQQLHVLSRLKSLLTLAYSFVAGSILIQ
jgi:hypothetical protein